MKFTKPFYGISQGAGNRTRTSHFRSVYTTTILHPEFQTQSEHITNYVFFKISDLNTCVRDCCELKRSSDKSISVLTNSTPETPDFFQL